MKNWLKPKNSVYKKLRVRLTRQVLQFSKKLKEPKLPLLRSLKKLADYQLNPNTFDLIKCPETLEVELDAICFSDLFFHEDIGSLQKGLSKLIANNPPSITRDKDDLDEWFNSLSNCRPGSMAAYNVVPIIFKENAKPPLNLLKHAHFQVKYISQTLIVLSIVIIPSDDLKRKFRDLVKSTPLPQYEISGVNLKYGVFSLSSRSASHTRVAELEELFLSINKSVVQLFRDKFGSGLSYFGPLPCIEVIKTNISLREIPIKNNFLKSDRFIACCNFFKTLGYPSQDSLIYGNKIWWQLYQLYRGEVFYRKSFDYQILISRFDYDKTVTHESLKSKYLTEFAIIINELFDVLSLIALEHFYEVLKDAVMDLKTELDPLLNEQRLGKISLGRLKVAFSKMSKLNGFHFQNFRIWSGLNEELLFSCLSNETVNVVRKGLLTDESVSFHDDVKRRIKSGRIFCEQQLDLLRLAYEQVLANETTTVNYKLQKSAFILSVVATILAIVTVIPEKIRDEIGRNLQEYLSSFLKLY